MITAAWCHLRTLGGALSTKKKLPVQAAVASLALARLAFFCRRRHQPRQTIARRYQAVSIGAGAVISNASFPNNVMVRLRAPLVHTSHRDSPPQIQDP
jgi:hypothetical protein